MLTYICIKYVLVSKIKYKIMNFVKIHTLTIDTLSFFAWILWILIAAYLLVGLLTIYHVLNFYLIRVPKKLFLLNQLVLKLFV